MTTTTTALETRVRDLVARGDVRAAATAAIKELGPEVLSAEGKKVQVDALMKRFERLKEKLAVRARELGLVG